MSKCPFCSAEVSEVNIHYLHMRVCPQCYSVFFPCGETMAFRNELPDLSRKLWLQALEAKAPVDPDISHACCIDHGEPLVDGKLPDYGFDGKVTTCCQMYHLTPSLTMQLLRHTLKTPFQKPTAKGKNHFFFIRFLDRWLNRKMGESEEDGEDPLDGIPFNIHLKKFFE